MQELKDYLLEELQNCRQKFPATWQAAIWGHRKEVQCLLHFDAIHSSTRFIEQPLLWPSVESDDQNVAPLFKAFADLDPRCVRVVVFGNDPYPSRHQATGRSFEQGDLACWETDLGNPRGRPGSLSASLMSVMSAAVATHPDARGHRLDEPDLQGRREKLRCVIRSTGNQVQLPPPCEIFGYWAQQGVLWVNRSLTFTSKQHQCFHRKLWAPFTRRVIARLVLEAKSRRIVFALWGNKAQELCVQIQDAKIKYRVPASNLKIVKAGHPSFPIYFFCRGNPLNQINDLLDNSRICWVPDPGNSCV